MDQLAALIPPPRKHRHRYHGVLAPNAPLRNAVTAQAGLPFDGSAGPLVPAAPFASSGAPSAPFLMVLAR
ncbi:MAG: transposase [Methylotetracoccus sp.]|nr:transposase [Methylotetracoccus sp.]